MFFDLIPCILSFFLGSTKLIRRFHHHPHHRESSTTLRSISRKQKRLCSFPSSFVFPISRSRFPVHPFCARTLKSKNSLTSLAAVTPKQKNYPNEPQHIQNQRKPGPTLLLCSMLLHHACTCACHPLAPCELVREDGRSSQGVAWPRPEKWKVAGQTINKTPA